MIIVNDDRGHGGETEPQPTSAAQDPEGPASRFQIIIDRDLCIGAASCVDLATKTFALDGENKAVLLDHPWNGEEEIMAAAKSCPTLAIIIKNAETGEQIFPS